MQPLSFLRSLLLLLLVASLMGCGAKNIADMPPPDQAVCIADELLNTYRDTYDEYNRIKDSIPPRYAEEKADFVLAMNIAKEAVPAMAYAAEAWKISVDAPLSGNATIDARSSLDARMKYQRQKEIADRIMGRALKLFTKIRGGDK